MENIHDFLKKEHTESNSRIEKEKLKKEDSVTVLFGDFSFFEGTMGEPSLAIINKIDKTTTCKIKELDTFCEDGLENYESYLIPEIYKGEIRGSY